MEKHNKTGRIAVAAAMLFGVSAAGHADDSRGNAMQAHVGDDGAAGAKGASTTQSADAIARAFEADMARLASEMNTQRAASSSTSPGVHGRVLGLDGMKMLMVKKNEDGTFSVSHVGGKSEDIEVFLESAANQRVEEE